MKYLARLRKTKGLTQEELGSAIESDGNSVSRYERGIVRPSIEIIQRLANYFEVPVDELLNGPATNEIEIRIILEETDNWEVESMDMGSNGPGTFSVHIGPHKIGVYVSGKFEDSSDLDDVFARARAKAEQTLEAQKTMNG